MCLVISLISLAFAYQFYDSENYTGTALSISIAAFFIILMIRNILKTKKERENNK